MIKIFDSNDKEFITNGIIAINPLKCLETKKKSLNGWYLDIEVPIKYKDYIEKDKLVVVKVKSKLNPQAFRINDNIEYTTRKISFTADHVMFDSKNYFLLDVRPTNMNALNSLIYINERTDNTSPFTIIESNVQGTDTSYFIRKSLFEAWTIIEEKFNGVFDADNFNISFNISTGTDRGEVICYGKNAQNVKIFEDWSEVCTKICPVGKDGLLLPEKYLESNKQYTQPYTRTRTFESALEEEQQTEENLIAELRANAENYLSSHSEPNVSYEVKSDINQLCEIGDTIHVKHPLINLITNVIEYEYDTNLERIKTLTFGNYTRDVKAKFDSIKTSINTLKEAVNTQNTIINEQTELINTLNKNGYVYIDDNEILILDALPKEQAQNVWRFGLGGIGFSSNGYEGPFETAITQDGKINANFIQVGQMSTSRIQGLDELILEINKIVDLTNTKEDINYLFLDNAMEGQLIELTLKGNIDLIYPSDELYPSDSLHPLDTYLIVDTARTLTENAKKYHLPIKQLKTTDTFKYSKGSCYLIHEDESIDDLGELDIQLFEGNNYIYLESFPNTILPEEYTQVEYIESNGTQYIDTGVNADDINYAFDIDFYGYETQPKQYSRIFGYQRSGGIFLGNKFWYGNNTNINCTDSLEIFNDERHSVFANKDYAIVDNVKYNLNTPPTSLTWNTFPKIAIFGAFEGGTGAIRNDSLSKIKLYGFKIYHNNNLIRNFIPAIRNNDNEVGLYDLVTNSFFTNRGTGSFIHGDIINQIELSANYVVKNKYTDVFSTKAEMNSAINLTNQTIDLKLEKKTDKDNIIAQINMSTEKDKDGSYIGIEADKLNFKGKKFNLTTDDIEIISNVLNIDKKGMVVIIDNSGNVSNFRIIKNTGETCDVWGRSIEFTESSVIHSRFGLNTLDIYNGSKYLTYDQGNLYISGQIYPSSLEKMKKNFEKLDNGLSIVNATDIYKYNMKYEDDDTKKHIGFIIGDSYKYSKEITSAKNNSVDLYSMVAVAYKAIQEQQEEIKEQQEEIKELKEMIKNGISTNNME